MISDRAMRKAVAIISLLIILSLSEQALSQRRTRRPALPDYYKHVASRQDTQNITRVILRNGLTVLISEMRTTPLVSLTTYVKAGHLVEPEDAPGVSSLIPQVLLRGPQMSAARMRLSARSIGCLLKAETDYDATILQMLAPRERLAEAVELQAETLQNPMFQPEIVGAEAELLAQHIEATDDAPEQFTAARLLELAYAGRAAPSGKTIRFFRPREESVRTLSAEKLTRFYQQFYHPANIILVLSGDLDTEKALAEVARRFGPMPAKPQAEKEGRLASKREAEHKEEADEPVRLGERGDLQWQEAKGFRYSQLRGHFSQARVLLGFRTPGLGHADYYPLLVLATMLGRGNASILSERLKERAKLINSVSAELKASKGFGLLQIQMQLEPENFDKAELSAFTEIEVLKEKEEIEPYHIDRAKSLAEKDFYQALETLSGRAALMARFEDLGGFSLLEKHVDKIRQVNEDALRRVLEKYLTFDNCSILEYLPESAESRNFTAETLRLTLEQLLPASVDERFSEKPPLIDFTKDLRPSNTAYIYKANQLIFPVNRASILRGPEVYIKEDHSLPLVSIAFFFPGGRMHETAANSGITELALYSAMRGTKKRTRQFIATQIELWGGTLVPVVENDYCGYILTILSANAEEAIGLLFDIVTNPTFDPEEVEREKQLQLARIAASNDLGPLRATELLHQALWPNHPYGLPFHGWAEAVKNLDAAAVKAWHQQRIAKTKPLIAISGETHGTVLASAIARNLGRIEYVDVRLPEPRNIKLEAVVKQQVEGGQARTAIALGFPLPPALSEEAYALDILRQRLIGPGGSLYEELRNKLRLTTDVKVHLEEGLLSGALIVEISTSPENEDKALQALRAELERLRSEPLTSEEFRMASDLALTCYQANLQVRSRLVSRIVKNVFIGHGHQELNEYADRIRNVVRDDVASAAERYMDVKGYALGIVRAKTKTDYGDANGDEGADFRAQIRTR